MAEIDNKALVAHEERIQILTSRENKVVKHNDLVQKSRFDLTLTEQKTINFLVSLIKPQKNCTDIQPLEFRIIAKFVVLIIPTEKIIKLFVIP